jgi:hypothetical protein
MTLNVTTKWIVEVFPFENPIPSDGDFVGKSLKKESSSDQTVRVITNDNLGIVSVNLSRSKGSPDGQCLVSMVGPLPPSFYVGAWAIVSSTTDKSSTAVTRFIGQIENIDISYNVSDISGNQYILSSLKIREWSAMLRMLVRYDVLSIVGAAADLGKIANASSLVSKKFIGPLNKGESADSNAIEQLMSSAWNPFEMGHIILKLIGAMNAADAIDTTNSIDGKTLPNIATIAPYIPQALLERLGIELDTLGNPFESGFMRVITGIQASPFYNDGSWGGVFDDIEELIADYKNGYEANKIHPLTYGLQAIVQNGSSAWDLLSTQCDNSVNEVYTDFLYEYGVDGSVVGKPVIVLRNKPFLLRKIRDGEISGIDLETDLSGFTIYDNLPRHNIPSESIVSFRVNSTFLNSPNYIRIGYSPSVGLNRTGEATALQAGRERLDPEMKRFGGNELEITTIYNGTEQIGISNEDSRTVKVPLDEWYKQLKDLAKSWYSYNYRMGTGIITIKENGLPLSVGNNVQFKFGQYYIVGHIEAITCDFQVEGDGLMTNLTTLTLSHIVQAVNGGTTLDFIDMTHFGNLLRSVPTQSEAGVGGGSKAAGKILSDLSGVSNKIKGLFG